MGRVAVQMIVFFLAPFVAYVGYLVLRQRYPFEVAAWSRTTVTMLSIVGLAMAGAAIFGLALLSEHHTGAYIPAHTENGQVIPGRFQ